MPPIRDAVRVTDDQDDQRWRQLSEELFRCPLSEFVTRRKALATALSQEKEKALAARVRQLAKPAWVAFLLNQLFYEQRPAWNAALLAGAAVRDAQRSGGAPLHEVQQLLASYRSTMKRLLLLVEQQAQLHGQRVSRAHERQLLDSLEVLMAGEAPAALHGRLTQPLSPTGFDAVAAGPEALQAVLSTSADVAAQNPTAPPADEAIGRPTAAAPQQDPESRLAKQKERVRRATHERDVRAEHCRRSREQHTQLLEQRRMAQAARDDIARRHQAVHETLRRAQAALTACQQQLTAADSDVQSVAAAADRSADELAQATQALADAEAELHAAEVALDGERNTCTDN